MMLAQMTSGCSASRYIRLIACSAIGHQLFFSTLSIPQTIQSPCEFTSISQIMHSSHLQLLKQITTVVTTTIITTTAVIWLIFNHVKWMTNYFNRPLFAVLMHTLFVSKVTQSNDRTVLLLNKCQGNYELQRSTFRLEWYQKFTAWNSIGEATEVWFHVCLFLCNWPIFLQLLKIRYNFYRHLNWQLQ